MPCAGILNQPPYIGWLLRQISIVSQRICQSLT